MMSYITVIHQTEQVQIKSNVNACIVLPNAALGRLINFEQLKTNVNMHLLAYYWTNNIKCFNQKMQMAMINYPSFILKNIPYVQLFIMSIIKSDDIVFDQLYPLITTADLETCVYISEFQFTENYTHKSEDKVAQSILKLFRHIKADKKQLAMLNSILKKLSLAHITSQIYMLECDKYNVMMYNLAAVHVAQMVKLSGKKSDLLSWKTWPYIYMPAINMNKQMSSALYETGPNWPLAALDGTVYRPTFKYTALISAHKQEMRNCHKLNPSLKKINSKQLSEPVDYPLPLAKKDYTELLGLTMPRAIEFSWPLNSSV